MTCENKIVMGDDLLRVNLLREFKDTVCNQLSTEIKDDGTVDSLGWIVGNIQYWSADAWNTILTNPLEKKLHTSESISFESKTGVWKRKRTFNPKDDFGVSISSGFLVAQPETFRYTYPLQVYDQSLLTVPALRCDPAWAVPLPCHILYNSEIVLVYGMDRNEGSGTLEIQPIVQGQSVRIGIACPDVEGTDIGTELEITEFIAIARLRDGDIPLLVAEKLAAKVMLAVPVAKQNQVEVADRIAYFLIKGGLWEADVFAPGSGWYRNMWVYTTGIHPTKNPYFDLGWGEGYGVLAMQALAANWKRTGNQHMKTLLQEMSRNIIRFRRKPDEPGAYYDRFNQAGVLSLLGAPVTGGTDFVGFKRIWSHSLGNIGFQLLDLYRSMTDFPDVETRRIWLAVGMEIGDFFKRHQKENGDIQDGFDEIDREINHKKHRIPARAIVCGLWTLISNITGNQSYLSCAVRLAEALSGEIMEYAFYNQMCDTHLKFPNLKQGADVATTKTGKSDTGMVEAANEEAEKTGTGNSEAAHEKAVEADPDPEIWDGENSSYAFLGLTELFLATSDEKIAQLCRISASYLISWVYFYDVPNGYHGRTRGGTTCRMPDFPLLYIGAGALACIPLVRFSQKTGDQFFRQIADEMVACILQYQWNDPEKPWHGGMVHALDQRDGSHWGPEKLGQVDSGMTSGMSLVVLEYWITLIEGYL